MPQVSNFLARKFTLWGFQLPEAILKVLGNNSKPYVIALKSLSENNDVVNVIKTVRSINMHSIDCEMWQVNW